MLPAPATRPSSGHINAVYFASSDDNFDNINEGFAAAFPREFRNFQFEDVSEFNRRLLITSPNFNASYRITSAGVNRQDTANVIGFLVDDGRDVLQLEQDILDSITTTVDDPYIVTIISSIPDVNIGDPVVLLTRNPNTCLLYTSPSPRDS